MYAIDGLVMTHVTREYLVWLVKSLEFEIRSGRRETSEVNEKTRLIAWKLHQLLRSDLGVSQPVLNSSLDRIRRKNKHINMKQLDELFYSIEHNEWFNEVAKKDSEIRTLKGEEELKPPSIWERLMRFLGR